MIQTLMFFAIIMKFNLGIAVFLLLGFETCK